MGALIQGLAPCMQMHVNPKLSIVALSLPLGAVSKRGLVRRVGSVTRLHPSRRCLHRREGLNSPPRKCLQQNTRWGL
jgi:hypothetical protein